MALGLKTVFGCNQLRRRCLAMGYLGAAVYLGGVITFMLVIIRASLKKNSFKILNFTRTIVVYEYFNKFTIMWVFGLLFVIAGIIFALHVVLLVGVYQERPKLLKVYVMSMTVYLVILFIIFIMLIVQSVKLLELEISLVLAIILYIHDLLVVRYYYLEMKELKQRSEGMNPV